LEECQHPLQFCFQNLNKLSHKKNLNKFQPIMVLQSMPKINILRLEILEGNAKNPPNFFFQKIFKIKDKIITEKMFK
jgi:hypothetical protein